MGSMAGGQVREANPGVGGSELADRREKRAQGRGRRVEEESREKEEDVEQANGKRRR